MASLLSPLWRVGVIYSRFLSLVWSFCCARWPISTVDRFQQFERIVKSDVLFYKTMLSSLQHRVCVLFGDFGRRRERAAPVVVIHRGENNRTLEVPEPTQGLNHQCSAVNTTSSQHLIFTCKFYVFKPNVCKQTPKSIGAEPKHIDIFST